MPGEGSGDAEGRHEVARTIPSDNENTHWSTSVDVGRGFTGCQVRVCFTACQVARATNTRAAILDAARTLFEENGYFAVGLEAVAAKAGISRQAIYLHFASKADLLRALHERVNAQDVAPAFEKVWAAETADAALDAWIDATAEAVPKFIGIANMLERGAAQRPRRAGNLGCARRRPLRRTASGSRPTPQAGEAADRRA